MRKAILIAILTLGAVAAISGARSKHSTRNVSRAVAVSPHHRQAIMPASISPWHEASRQHGANGAA